MQSFEEYGLCRNDWKEWLTPLLGKTLVCDCQDPQDCRGLLLCQWCKDIVNSEASLAVTMADEYHLHEDEDGMHDVVVDFDEASDLASATSGKAQPCEGEGSLDDAVAISDETTRSANLPAQPSWPPEWTALVQKMRGYTQRAFWEIFCGTMVATIAFAAVGWQVGPGIDVLIHDSYNIMNPLFLSLIFGLLLEGRVRCLWLAPPCSSFSIAWNSCWKTQLRDLLSGEPLHGLRAEHVKKISMGDALCDIAIRLFEVLVRANGDAVLEQPKSSLMFKLKRFRQCVRRLALHTVSRDVCLDGAPWRKPTTLVTTCPRLWDIHAQCCDRNHQHIQFRGQSPSGKPWTLIASAYWRPFMDTVASCFDGMQADPTTVATSYKAGMLPTVSVAQIDKLIEEAGFVPVGKRSSLTVGAAISSGGQSAKRVMPQLIPDHLTPEEHQEVAMQCPHPMSVGTTLFPPVRYAIEATKWLDTETVQWYRDRNLETIKELAAELDEEMQHCLKYVHPYTYKVLVQNQHTRHAPLMRELAMVAQIEDWSCCPTLLVGAPMLGHAVWVLGMMTRSTSATASIQDFLAMAPARNAKLIQLATATLIRSWIRKHGRRQMVTLAEASRWVPSTR